MMRVNRYSTELDNDGAAMLVKESAENYPGIDQMNDPDSIYRFCTDFLRLNKKPDEFVYILCFNAKYRMIGFFELSHGSHDRSFAEPREIFRNALLLNAVSIVMVHNHPSGDSTPSVQDRQIFERLRSAGDIVGIKVADSIVIGQGNYCSLTINR